MQTLGRIIAFLAVIAVVLLGLHKLNTTSGNNTASPTLDTVANTSLSSPTDPLSAEDSNLDTRTPSVRTGDQTTTWSALNTLLGSDDAYTSCLKNTTGIDLAANISWLKSVDHRQLFIVALNSNMSNEAIRTRVARDNGIDTAGMHVERKSSITNTTGLKPDNCREFTDKRSVLKVSLGWPKVDKNGKFVGLDYDFGAFVDCHNPWRSTDTPPSPTVPPSPSPSGSTTPPTPSGSSPPPSGPPSTHPPTPLDTKVPSQDPGAQHHVGNGAGTNADPGSGDYDPPKQMSQPPKVQPKPPAPPAATHAPKPPEVHPSATPALPTVDPGDGNNNGHVVLPPAGSDDCNGFC